MTVAKQSKKQPQSDIVCPQCKTTSYLNPSIKIFMSTCFHRMCNSCVDRIFLLGAAPCPVCNLILRKSNLSPQLFDDILVEKECRIRKSIHSYMNLIEPDFDSYLSYNNYLEKVEDYTFKLLEANGKDESIYDELEKFKEEHLMNITKNAKLQNDEATRLRMQIKFEESEKARREHDHLANIKRANYEKISTKATLLTELETSSKPATVILEKSFSRAKASTTTYLPSSISKKLAENLPSFDENTIMSIEDDAQEDLPPFDPLEGCIKLALPFDISQVLHDPILDGWICRIDVVAGGCKPHIFQERALHSSYAIVNTTP
ncbi:TFIIH/NER complex subunit [Mitosporidium daphniae]